jgi:hypothetical protein
MGFDTHTIAGSRACSPSTQPIHPTTTRETSPHYAGALAEDRVGIGVVRIGDAAVAYKMNRPTRSTTRRPTRTARRRGRSSQPGVDG